MLLPAATAWTWLKIGFCALLKLWIQMMSLYKLITIKYPGSLDGLQFPELSWSSMRLHEIPWACIKFLSFSEQLTRISQCLLTNHLLRTSFLPCWNLKRLARRWTISPCKNTAYRLFGSDRSPRSQDVVCLSVCAWYFAEMSSNSFLKSSGGF